MNSAQRMKVTRAGGKEGGGMFCISDCLTEQTAYGATIAATGSVEAQALLEKQKEEVKFGEKVLRHIAKDEGGETTPAEK